MDIRVGALPQGGGMTMLTRAEIGALGERLAADHLTGLGLRIVARNWRCRYGELDVIAVDPVTDTVVFVEVKTRTGDGFGGLAQAVTPQKARRLRRLAGDLAGRSGPALGGGPHRRDRRAHRPTPDPGNHATCRASADGARACVLGRGAGTGRPDRGDRSRHHLGPAGRAPGRPARRRVAGVTRPGPRRDHQLQQQLADVAPHAGAVTGNAAENGFGL